MDKLKSLSAKLMGVATAVGVGATALAGKVFAAVDPDIASSTQSLAETVKENVVGAITANLPTIVIAGVLVLSIGIIWNMIKRFSRGR